MIDRITTMLLSDDRLLQAAHIALAAIAAATLGLGAAHLARRTTPLRYGLLLTALCLAAAAPLIAAAAHLTRAGLVQVRLEPVAVPAPPAAMPPADVQQTMAISPRVDIAPGRAEPTPPPRIQPPRPWGRILCTWLIAIWAAGTVISLLHLAMGVLRLMRIGRLLVPCDDPRLRRCIQRAAELLGLASLPRACTCPALPIPMVLGLFRPKLVMPASLLDELTDEQLQAVILHETAHIAHRDIWVGLLQRLAAALFWWCPLVHWLNRRLTDLREQICDNYVMRTQGDGFALAEVLVQLAERIGQIARPRLAVALGIVEPAADGLEGRVARLLQKECNTMTRMNRTAMMMTGAFALLLGGVMLVTTVRAADKPKDAANAKTPQLCVRPAKQQGQFDLELRLPGKDSNPRMTVEAGKWGMLEVALDAATQLSFRARIDADKPQVRVSGQVTVAVTGGFQQWTFDDEPWPVGEWKALTEKATSQPAAQEPPGAVRPDVFAKIIVPSKGGGATGPHEVEPWIAKELSARGVPISRGVTAWIRLPEGDANDVAHLWDGNLDGKTYACPASGCVGKRTAETVTVDLFGFGPFGPEIQGSTVSLRRGARGIAVMNQGQAFVALHVGLVDQAATTQPAAATRPIDQAKAAKADTVVRGVLTPARTPEQSGWPTYTLTVAACYKAPPDRSVKAGQTITVKTIKEIKGMATFYLVWDDRQGLYRLADPSGDGGVSHVEAAAPAAARHAVTVEPPIEMLRSPIEVENVFAEGTITKIGQDWIELHTPKRELPDPLRPKITDKTAVIRDGKPARVADLKVGIRVKVSFGEDVNSETAQRIEILQASTPASAPAANDSGWGRALDGLQTRLTAEKDRVKAGEPVRLKLELRNVGAEVKQFDAQRVAVNNPLIVRGPKGEEISFVAGRVSTLGETQSIKPGETVVLFDGLDAAGQYPLTAPGVYTFQFRGRKAIAFLGEGETSIPPSNTTHVELTGDVPATTPATHPTATDSGKAGDDLSALYAKVLFVLKKPPREKDRPEPWIAKELAARGHANAMAVSGWVRLGDAGAKTATPIWDGQSDWFDDGRKVWGCSVGEARIVERGGDGAVTVEISSFMSNSALVRLKVADGRGSRAITVVDDVGDHWPCTYVALHVGPPAAELPATRPAGTVRVRILSGSDRDPARDAVEEWIAKGLADAGSPVTSALTDWMTLSDHERELYSSMQGGRIIKGRVNDKGEVEITGMKIGQSPRIIAVRSGQKQVVKLTNYPGAGNVFIAVEAPATRPADAPVRVTDADNGKTLQAVVGQEVRVSLDGERKQTGWEVRDQQGEALIPLTEGGAIGGTKIPAVEFTPKAAGMDDIGTYTFRYTAVAKGTSSLRFVYVYPGGSKPTDRRKTLLVREFRVTVAVGAPATRPAAARTATLLGDLKTFTLQLNYSGQQDKPYYHLLLSVPPLPGKDRDNPFYRQARVTEQQAKAIIEYLLKNGYFDVALDGNRNRGPLPPKESYYSLALRVENDGNPVQFEEWLPLAKPLLYQRLDGLRGVLEGAAAKDMDLLIGRLAGHRKEATTQPAAATSPAATQPVDEKAVGELIRLLGDDAFAVREDATRKLLAMGKAIHPILKARLQEAGLDAEIAARIRTMVDPTVEVRLRISNQSQRLGAADIRVTIDDKEIMSKVLHVGMGHNFERIVTPLTEGEHTLTVESKAGTVKQEMRIRISKEKRWIDINFWSPPSKFTIEVCNSDRPTL